jgi:hypothetical protein
VLKYNTHIAKVHCQNSKPLIQNAKPHKQNSKPLLRQGDTPKKLKIARFATKKNPLQDYRGDNQN